MDSELRGAMVQGTAISSFIGASCLGNPATLEIIVDSDTKKFACVVFFAISAVILQLSVAVAIVMAWGWIALFGYAFIGTFVNAFAGRYCQWKLIP
jgi:hypothetical protein